MADTRANIMKLAVVLIRKRGYNAFSYIDISIPLRIKNAAVHYHFPKKSDLAVAIIQQAHEKHEEAWQKHTYSTAGEKLDVFLDVYVKSHNKGIVCLVGAMAAEFNSFEAPVRKELKKMVDHITTKVTGILEEGKKTGEFRFKEPSHQKALLIISNMLAALQLERISGKADFNEIREGVLNGLKA
jgi:TetR/AcrR family transcriptional repressor of nem operon